MTESTFRLSIFAAAFLFFSTLEAAIPRRRRIQSRLKRWTTNASLLVIATMLVRVLALAAPLLAMTAAASLSLELGWGLLHYIELPLVVSVLLAIAALDLAIWFQHLISHKVPLFWRFHRVHHADRDLDASSALRFHPIEIAASSLYKLVLVFLLGPSVIAVILFEVVLNASAMFNHANLALPRWLDRILRTILVTPDMHRVHHSVHSHEHDTNFGFCLSLWDRIFGTYTSEPQDGHIDMKIGLSDQQDATTDSLSWSLKYPVK
ncbi:MAG: sterol desaturase family protein [Henriciella sp.]|nr:sterol desaturase family protein [Henriciella sp.]MBO6695709.1 sterol desaturase family protein [Henriciella sp.]